MCGPRDGGKLGLRQTDRLAVQHSAGNSRPWCGFDRSFLLARLFFFGLQHLAVYRTNPDIGSRTLIAVTAYDHHMVKDLIPVTAEAAGEDFAGYQAGSDLDSSIHGKNRASS